MKKLSYQLLILSVICMAGLSGCTNDENITEQGAADFTINVQTEEFTPETETRTPVEEGYKTVFKGGEQIGITAVKNGVVYNGMDNIPFTYDAATKAWKPTDSSVLPQLYYYPGISYIAYYPYDDAGMDGKKSEQEIIDAFTPQADQSTYANYTASDLMIATGTANAANKTLSFSLRHAMAMVSVCALTNKFITSATDGYEYSPGEDFAVINLPESAITVGTEEVKPYPMSDGTHRAIIRPNATAQTIKIQYKWVDLVEYTDNTSRTSTAGKYHYYSFKMPESTPYIRPINTGDYFYRDGKILPREALVIRDPKNCVGVVLEAASGSDSSYGGNCENNKIHGHVFSVYNVAYCKWGPNGNIGTNTPDSWGDYRGYQLTQNMKKDADTNHGGLSASNYAAAYYCLNYGNTDNGRLETSKTSGWYFPSEGFMWKLEGWHLGTVRASLSKLAALSCGADFNNAYYWDSSTGDNDTTARVVNILHGGMGAMGRFGNRSNSYYVRALLTF